MEVLVSEMKEQRLLESHESHERYKTDSEFLDRVMTGDETCGRNGVSSHEKRKHEPIGNQDNAYIFL